MSNFRLRKWYLDAADDHSNVYIGYWATLEWKSLALRFYQHLWHPATQSATSCAGFSRSPAPEHGADGKLQWNTPEAQSVWKAPTSDAISETILQTDQGAIRWQCWQPKARAVIRSAPLSFTGWGYTECIDITIPVWKLPFHTLYWGRCHSDNHYMVWIKWDGPAEQSLLWHDGQRTAEFAPSDTRISAPAITMEIEASATLRSGPIGSTVFQALGKVASMFPASALQINEHKVYGQGKIISGGVCEPATAIYERVTW